MSRYYFLLIFLGISITVFSQENVRVFGNLSTDNRVRLLDENAWSWNETRLDLQFEKKVPDKAKFYSDVWLRTFGFPGITRVNQLFDQDQVSPYNLDFREAYVELYGFLFKKLDIKIGRQRIAWGTADKLNPTDNLNPYNLEDIWDFGRHNASEAIKLIYYIKDYKIEGVYIPFFKPATLPLGDWSSALMPSSMNFPSSFSFDTLQINLFVNNINDNLQLPAYNFKEGATGGLKFKGMLGGFDFSLSYMYGRDGLPLPVENQVVIDSLTFSNSVNAYLDVNSKIIYPRMHIFGADIAGSIGSVGVWAEAAMFKPAEKYVMTTQLPDLSGIISFPVSGMTLTLPDSVVLDDEPYVKFVLGTDYTFGNGSYVNFQYLHGFIHERGNDALNDYFMLRYERSFFNEKLKVSPVSGGFIVADWKDIGANYALIYMPEITYYPGDNSEIGLGVRILDGKGDNSFAGFKDFDELYFRVKYSF